MKLSNKWTSSLLGKDRNKAIKAAEHIINTVDVEAWQCLIDNSDFLFDYIKNKAGKNLINAVNNDNAEKLISLFGIHSPDWDEYTAQALSKLSNERIEQKLSELLKNGTEAQKAYAAKYFCYVKNNANAEALFEASFCEYQPLKVNAARALGFLKDEKSYNYFLDKLNSDDDWEKIDAAQFLSSYGDKNAFTHLLKAMSNSAMAEHIAGEAATLDGIYKYFDDENSEIRDLSLECFDNILSGLAEVWPLSIVFNFDIYECIETLLELSQTVEDDSIKGRYSQLLLKAKAKFKLFIENEEYRYDEDNNVIGELNEINHILNCQNEKFWEELTQNIHLEFKTPCPKRKTAAISIIKELRLKSFADDLLELLKSSSGNEVVLCEAILTLKKLDLVSEVDNKDSLVENINDPNLCAIIKNALML